MTVMVALTPKRKAISLTLLSIMVPLSLLSAFRLTGIIPEPPTPETITLETLDIKVGRPSESVEFHDNVTNVYSDNSIRVGLVIPRYVESDEWSGDFLEIRAFFNGSFSTVSAKFQPVDADSVIDIDEEVLQNPPRYPRAVVNMSLTGIEGVGTNIAEAYVRAKATSSTSKLTIITYWLFYDIVEHNKNHVLKMTFEVSYFNGAVNLKITAPVILEILVGEV